MEDRRGTLKKTTLKGGALLRLWKDRVQVHHAHWTNPLHVIAYKPRDVLFGNSPCFVCNQQTFLNLKLRSVICVTVTQNIPA